MKAQFNHSDSNLIDTLGMILSGLCALHCVALPVVMLSLPLMARYYLAHPLFHLVFAAVILPLGLWAFFRGYVHHRKSWILSLGMVGLVMISLLPPLLHGQIGGIKLEWNEPLLMLVASVVLIFAHYKNQRACGCAGHQH
ncbi:MAG: MerC domain-containing protein [Proteobacteria bacterium]|nr:MerC domain-containing protein [Pseudomonadota bacterium]